MSENIIQTTKYATDEDSDIAGTHLVGYIETYFWHLQELFGNPVADQQDKVTAEWRLQKGNRVITIYDWKQEITPLGLYLWHIGAKSQQDIYDFFEDFPDLKKRWITTTEMRANISKSLNWK